MEKNFEKGVAKYYEKFGIEFDQKWPFPVDSFNRLKYFIGIDWSGTGNDIENQEGEIERPVFYAVRGSSRPHMACVKPSRQQGRHPKYRDLDSIANVQNIMHNKELWYCAVDQLQLPEAEKINEDYLTKIITKLAKRVSEERNLELSRIGILLDGWFKNREKIVDILKRKDKNISLQNIVSCEDGDRSIRVVNSADSVAYYLRNHYIETGEVLRPDRRVLVGGDLNLI